MKYSLFIMISVLMVGSLVLISCSQKKPDAMKECMKSLSHMQCVKKLNKNE